MESASPCPSPTYSYNAENQLISTAGVTYNYDGDGKRVSKSNGKLYWYGGARDPIAETDASGNTTNEYIFFGGERIARRDSAGNIVYYTTDHIGTSRIVTNSTGSILDESDFYPFGGERVITSSSGNTYKFTGKERDSESGLDNFSARYNSSSIGRFMSPDPIAGTIENPQSLNRYAYVLDNPLALTDPTGMIAVWSDSKKSKKDGKTNAQRAFERKLKDLQHSKNAKDRANGATLQKTYDRLIASKATFEVVNSDPSGSSRGDIEYNGNDHFTINLKGSSDYYGFSDNQKIAHEFEHGRQVLDGELSFRYDDGLGKWTPFAHDLTDEAKGFEAGFQIEPVEPYQGTIINGAANALRSGGIPSEAQYLNDHIQGYRGLPMQLNVPNPPPPGVYQVPK
ncbi:MAG: RHS repeat-associated core domain-containing protein [Candidatus Acidiferrales bacterium]